MKGDRKSHNHSAVSKRREGGKSTYKLKCRADCEKGECDKRRRKENHDTVTEWRACDDTERGCNLYLKTDARDKQRIDCFTLGCDDGYECHLVGPNSIESEGVKTIRWILACVKK